MTTSYVDCSSNNGIPNLAHYTAAGHHKLSVKTSEGTDYHWFSGESVIGAAHGHGLRVEHYHWLSPHQSWQAQLAFYLRYTTPRFRAGDNPMTDFEKTMNYATRQWRSDVSDAHRVDQLLHFNEGVHRALGVYPSTYTGLWYLQGHPSYIAALKDKPVTMSYYDYVGDGRPPNPYGLHYVAWQFTDRARVAGFSGPVDYNRTLVTTPAPDSGGSTPITPEVADMYTILYDQEQRKWFAWGPGFWHQFTSTAELTFMAAQKGCLNGAETRKVLGIKGTKRVAALAAFGMSTAHATMVKNFAKKG